MDPERVLPTQTINRPFTSTVPQTLFFRPLIPTPSFLDREHFPANPIARRCFTIDQSRVDTRPSKPDTVNAYIC